MAICSQIHRGSRMFRPMLSQKSRMPATSESRDVMIRPPPADTTRPESEYKLMSRSEPALGPETSYARLNSPSTVSAMARRSEWVSDAPPEVHAPESRASSRRVAWARRHIGVLVNVSCEERPAGVSPTHPRGGYPAIRSSSPLSSSADAVCPTTWTSTDL